MLNPWVKIAAICSVLMGIVLFCVIFGGYSSLYRAQNRIETSKEFLTNVCQVRLNFLPQLSDTIKTSENKKIVAELHHTSENTQKILQQIISTKTPLNNALTLQLETSQQALTLHLANLLLQLDQSMDKNNNPFQAIKKQLFLAQNTLFVSKRRYNKEITYFNTRTTAFPGVLIAKLFGFNKIKYFKLSEGSLLPSDKVFTGKAQSTES